MSETITVEELANKLGKPVAYVLKQVENARTRENRILFKVRLIEIINTYDIGSDSNTPDYILADYLMNCLHNFNIAINDRDDHRKAC